MYLGVKGGLNIGEAFIFFWIFELLSSIVAIGYICHVTEASLRSYLQNVVMRILPPLLFMIATTYMVHEVVTPSPLRIILMGTATTIVGITAIWLISLQSSERTYITQTIISKFKRS
jgi:hypothetical protein